MAPTATYDLFVSYAHQDNADHWIEAFVAAIREQHARFSPLPLEIFLDLEEIRTMDDWEHRILAGLRSSTLMLAFLSPRYFASAYCRREWETYLDHERHRGAPDALATVYTATVPEFEEATAASALEAWLRDLRRRQYVDVRDWRPEGPRALARADVRRRLELLEQRLSDRLEAADRVAASPTTVPPHNERFAGRVEELRQVREALALGRLGALVAVHGLAGVGKSALVHQYAHAYGGEYPGGRYLVACAPLEDLRIALVNLGAQMGLALTDEERASLDLAAARVRAALEQAERTLVILDNVDHPALLSPDACNRYLPRSDRLHVLATTRLAPDQLPGVTCLALDALPEQEGIELLEKHRPFADPGEREAAGAIVRRLGGHTLALEVVAVYLWQHAVVSYASYLERLTREGIAAVDSAATQPGVAPSRHERQLLPDLLGSTLAALAPPELQAVRLAALMAPDTVALSWLRSLTGDGFPDVAAEPAPGYPDPWRQLERTLQGRRLLTPGADPHVARIHRLVADVVAGGTSDDERQRLGRAVIAHATRRAADLRRAWADRDRRWEIEPVAGLAGVALDRGDAEGGAALANRIQEPLRELGRLGECRDLLRRALAAQSDALGPDHPELGTTCSNLAITEHALGEFQTARDLLQRALGFEQRAFQPDHLVLAVRLANLAAVERDLGNLPAAADLLRRARTLQESRLGPGDTALAATYSNLAVVERDLGNATEARELLVAALGIEERHLGPDHPALAATCSNLALVEHRLGNGARALELLRRAVRILRRGLEPDAPGLAVVYANLGLVQRARGRLRSARVLLLRALKIQERVLGPGHLSVRRTAAGLALVEQELGMPRPDPGPDRPPG